MHAAAATRAMWPLSWVLRVLRLGHRHYYAVDFSPSQLPIVRACALPSPLCPYDLAPAKHMPIPHKWIDCNAVSFYTGIPELSALLSIGKIEEKKEEIGGKSPLIKQNEQGKLWRMRGVPGGRGVRAGGTGAGRARRDPGARRPGRRDGLRVRALCGAQARGAPVFERKITSDAAPGRSDAVPPTSSIGQTATPAEARALAAVRQPATVRAPVEVSGSAPPASR